MKILTKAEFLKCPPGTIFSNYQPIVFEGLYVKGESWSENDFYLSCVLDDFDHSDTGEFADACERMQGGENVPMVFGGTEQREALYDSSTLYAVWSREDVASFAQFLTQLLQVASPAAAASAPSPAARPDPAASAAQASAHQDADPSARAPADPSAGLASAAAVEAERQP